MTGHDDAYAILLATYHPSLHLLGLSTVHGNASLSQTTHNALSVLEAIGKPRVSVFPGTAHPFCRVIHTASDIHGASGLAGSGLLPEPSRSALAHCNAILEMRASLRAQPANTAWLVATGPLTNVALLFALDPDLVNHIAGLSIMGGSIGGDFTHVTMGGPPQLNTITGATHDRIGNRTPWAEFNIWADPEAARAVLQNPVLQAKTTLIPLDLTHQAYATQQVRDLLLHGHRQRRDPSSSSDPSKPQLQPPTRLRTMFTELLMFFAQTYADVFGLTEGPPLHDPIAVAVLLGALPDPAKRIAFDDRGGERWNVDVVLEGEQVGRTVATKARNGIGITIPRSLDLDRFWSTLESCMARADEATGYTR
ncbi:Uridine nucleosidase 1 [Exophiala dermatitidis]|uniref:Uridine nucleosidase 1 n=1 Tax=Exophiala dermatitidis TaxID=5970 RepID=A0AAN6EQG2_EXODE|nr:Uridine nucleosidase 1 [Exophiala dermatitidis]KAJ4512484.1 Uridine nucleosidase 1 [Exophiala dermatitidis]KAJ4512642.1 Uridine nucleosidase 1 [Exophiala dermatitidis]KAJ4542442.1 Uridine nucleosidase 1 [Exophiala dermatitidis]KAJ4546621.1 Uridine nucleosidase 1 [Exophiala dermatitidis]